MQKLHFKNNNYYYLTGHSLGNNILFEGVNTL